KVDGSIRITMAGRGKVVILWKKENDMKIDNIITKEEGKTYLYNWQCYFAEIVRSHKYECVNTDYGQIMIENGYCFLLDAHNEMIWESCIAIEDLEVMADMVWNKCCCIMGGSMIESQGSR
ncbi:MAG: hypothetical protein K2H60_17120, partial [Muribaculaceae bacterium]|nr:hypothetical protein [Muribaculaceae bacterium]